MKVSPVRRMKNRFRPVLPGHGPLLPTAARPAPHPSAPGTAHDPCE